MSETTELPCIYGTAVMKTCPVRATLTEPSIEKYKKSADPNVEQVKLMSEIIANANNMTFIQLVAFCNSCPFLCEFKRERETRK